MCGPPQKKGNIFSVLSRKFCGSRLRQIKVTDEPRREIPFFCHEKMCGPPQKKGNIFSVLSRKFCGSRLRQIKVTDEPRREIAFFCHGIPFSVKPPEIPKKKTLLQPIRFHKYAGFDGRDSTSAERGIRCHERSGNISHKKILKTQCNHQMARTRYTDDVDNRGKHCDRAVIWLHGWSRGGGERVGVDRRRLERAGLLGRG